MRLEHLLNTRFPLIQAPMAGVQGSALAIAVSNAGGLGSLPAAMLSLDGLVQELAALQAGTAHAYNVNFFCHVPPIPDAGRAAIWRQQLAPYYQELGVDPDAMPPPPARQPFNEATAERVAPFRPPVVSFHFGLPRQALVQEVKSWGSRILASATTLEEALWLEDHGADAIIAQGLEAGGHRGMFLTEDLSTQTGTFALVAKLARAVKIPVIAAGGIADAAGVKAARALGAAGVQVGTAYLLCPEASTSPLHRNALQQARAHHTALTNLFSGRPARGIVNRVMRELGPMNPLAPEFPLAGIDMAPLKLKAESLGSDEFSSLWCGQNPQGCQAIPAAELTGALARGFNP